MKITNHLVALVADIHIGVHQANNTWHDICLDFARWLKHTLNKRDIKDIIILGDVLDNRNEVSVASLHVLYQFFKILEDFNITIILGNHDCFYSRRADVHSIGTLNDWANIEVIDKVLTISQFEKQITLCPWHTQLDEMPKSDIIFGHFDINTFKMNRSEFMCMNGTDAQDLLSKAPLIVSGHFHRMEERTYNNGKVLYVGSPFEQNWGEASTPKGIYTLDIYDNKLTFIPNNKSPRHIKIRLSEILAVGRITDNIKKEFNNNIIALLIDAEVDQKTIDVLVAKLHALKPKSIKVDNLMLASHTVSVDEDMKFEGIDVKQDIVKFVDELSEIDNKGPLIDYLISVYDQCSKDAQ